MHLIKRYPSVWLVSCLLLLIGSAPSAWAQEPAGRLMFVHGQVWIERAGDRLEAQRQDEIFPGDTLITEAASSAQIRFTDGGTNALRPNTHYTLKDYDNNQANPSASRKSAELVRGGLRSITGAIGRAAPENVEYDTPVATMGIRGTAFQAIHSDLGTHLQVESGGVSITSDAGTRIARAGQAFRVADRNQLPTRIPMDDPIFEEEESQSPAPVADESEQSSTASSEEASSQAASGVSSADTETAVTSSLQSPTEEIRQQEPNDQEADAARDEELYCQSLEFDSCAARDEFLAAEEACQAEGFDSCTAKEQQLVIEEQREENCSDLGFASCDEMLGITENYYLADSPITASGSTQVMIGSQMYELAGDQAQWLESEGVPVLGAFSNPTQVRLQTPKDATPFFSGALPASEHSGTTSFYWGVWSEDSFQLLNPETLEPLDQESYDLHYLAASQMISDSAADALSSLQSTLEVPVRFYIAGGTPMTTSDESSIQLDFQRSYVEFDGNQTANNIFVSLEFDYQVPDSFSASYLTSGRTGLDSLTSEGSTFPVYSLEELIEADCTEFDCGISPETAGESTIWLSLTGDAVVDGALSRLSIRLGEEDEETLSYGAIAWLIKSAEEREEHQCFLDGFESCAARDEFLAEEAAELAREENCSDLGFASCDEMLGITENYYLADSPITASGSTQVMIGSQMYELAGDQAQWLESEGVPVLGAFSNPTQVRLQTPKDATPFFSNALPASEHSGTTSFYWGVWSGESFALLNPETLEPLEVSGSLDDLHYLAATHLITEDIESLLNQRLDYLGGSIHFIVAGGTGLQALSTSHSEGLHISPMSELVYADGTFDISIELNKGESSFESDEPIISFESNWLLEAEGVSVADLIDENGNLLQVSRQELCFDCFPGDDTNITFLDDSSAVIWFVFTGDEEIDGAISRLQMDIEDFEAYGNLVWLAQNEEHQHPGFSIEAEASCSDLGYATCGDMLDQGAELFTQQSWLHLVSKNDSWPELDHETNIGNTSRWITSTEGSPYLIAYENPDYERFQGGIDGPEQADSLSSKGADFYWGRWAAETYKFLDVETLEPLEEDPAIGLDYIASTNRIHELALVQSLIEDLAEPMFEGGFVMFSYAGGTAASGMETETGQLLTLSEESYLEYSSQHQEVSFDLYFEYGAEDSFVFYGFRLAEDFFNEGITNEGENPGESTGFADLSMTGWFAGSEGEGLAGYAANIRLDIFADSDRMTQMDTGWGTAVFAAPDKPEINPVGLVSGLDPELSAFIIFANLNPGNETLLDSNSNRWSLTTEAPDPNTLAIAGGEVSWGYWDEESYERTDELTGNPLPSLGELHYIYSELELFENAEIPLSATFNWAGGTHLANESGMGASSIDSLTNMEFNDGHLTFNLHLTDYSHLQAENLPINSVLENGQLNLDSLTRVGTEGEFIGGSLKGYFVGDYDALLTEIRAIHETSGEHWGVGIMERQ